MFPRAGRNISPQTERKDVSRETSSPFIRVNAGDMMPEIVHLSIYRPSACSLHHPAAPPSMHSRHLNPAGETLHFVSVRDDAAVCARGGG
jgi:hypothetical protein